jgi:ectoine hydroxylase-related dioxygenase (phytanoyl-CoA dioxygenase family)
MRDMKPASTGTNLPAAVAGDLDRNGFAILPSELAPDRAASLKRAFDTAVSEAASTDIRTGRTTTRVAGFVNRGTAFEDLYVRPLLLAAAARVVGHEFKLSAFHARTVLPYTPSQELHVDVPWGATDWPLLGFIIMIDAFRHDNGATRFVPGSHLSEREPDSASEVLACGPAGSFIVFHGSVWHGHSANTSGQPRRSLQGAFIPSAGVAATDFASRMRPETFARLTPAARQVIFPKAAVAH